MKRFLSVLLVFMLALLFIRFDVHATSYMPHTIITNPGEDASSEMNISWHMDKEARGAKIVYTKKSDTEWEDAITLEAISEDSDVFENMASKNAKGEDIIENPHIQHCTVDLKDLESDTEYMYRVGSDVLSEVHYFKTAGAESFSFVWISDWHAYTPLPGRLTSAMNMIDTVIAEDKNVDFIFSTGDNAAWGGSHSFWQDMYEQEHFKNYMWASVNGNHDNMDKTNTKNTHLFFKTVNNNPKNGYGDQDGVCYYFKYNNVLFIILNNEIMGTSISNPAVIEAQEWVAEVIEQNPSQYIFVATHYEWFNGISGTSRDYGYERWKDFFDEHGVDLAMAGNNHIYLRTKPLYNDEVVDADKGTVYITAPSSDNERGQNMNDSLSYNQEKIAYRFTEGGKTVGATLVTVNSNKVTTKLLDRNGNILDTCEIPAKREAFPMEDLDIAAFERSFKYYASQSLDGAGVVTSSVEALGYVYKIEYYDDKNNLLATNPFKNKGQTQFGLTGLKNSEYIMVLVQYKDLSTSQIKIYKSDSTIYDLQIIIDEERIKVVWDYPYEEDKQSLKYIFINGEFVKSVYAYQKEVEIESLKAGDIVDIRDGVDAKSVIDATQYYMYGDINMDGNINETDVKEVQSYIVGLKDLSMGEKSLVDINSDGKIDMLDVTYIHLHVKGKISSLNKKKAFVSFYDHLGNYLEEKEVVVGGNVFAPSISDLQGYNFLGWDSDLYGINGNMNVNLVCETIPNRISIDSFKESQVGKTLPLNFTVYPLQTYQEVTWTLSDNSIAHIDNNQITFLRAGEVKITATSRFGNIEKSFTVTVHDDLEIKADRYVYNDPDIKSITINGLDYRIEGLVFTSIQEAINASQEQDRIVVLPGTYDEVITIDKKINLVSINENIIPDTNERMPESILKDVMIIKSGATIKGFTFNYSKSQSSVTGLIYTTGGENIKDLDISYNHIICRSLGSHTGIIRLGNSLNNKVLENIIISNNYIESTGTNSIISNRYRDLTQASSDVNCKTTLKNVIIKNNITSGGVFGNLNLEFGENGYVEIANNAFGEATNHIIRFSTGTGQVKLVNHDESEVTIGSGVSIEYIGE